jgi:hypothetical protein
MRVSKKMIKKCFRIPNFYNQNLVLLMYYRYIYENRKMIKIVKNHAINHILKNPPKFPHVYKNVLIT